MAGVRQKSNEVCYFHLCGNRSVVALKQFLPVVSQSRPSGILMRVSAATGHTSELGCYPFALGFQLHYLCRTADSLESGLPYRGQKFPYCRL